MSIEYQLPYSGLRIDFVLTGQDDTGADRAIIIEIRAIFGLMSPLDIENIIQALVLKNLGRKTGKPEMDSWRNSLGYMDRVLREPLFRMIAA